MAKTQTHSPHFTEAQPAGGLRANDFGSTQRSSKGRILMLLENESCPEDTRVAQEARSLCADGYEVIVICPTGDSGKKHEWVDGVCIYRYPRPWVMRGFIGYVLE